MKDPKKHTERKRSAFFGLEAKWFKEQGSSSSYDSNKYL